MSVMNDGPYDAGTVPPGHNGYWLNFDGGELTVHAPDGQTVMTLPAVSGKPGSNAADQDKRDYGPLPEGTYRIEASEFLIGGPGRFSLGDWGSFAIDLHADGGTDTHGRSGFLIHGGVERGSAGCIDVGPADKDLYAALKDVAGPIYVTIRYDNPNAFNWVEGDTAWDVPAGIPQWHNWARPREPDDATNGVDSNGDGIADMTPAPPPAGVDSDGDGEPDTTEAPPNNGPTATATDGTREVDSDGDGAPDTTEAAPAATDAAREVDYDGDGVADGTEAAPAALLNDGVGGDDSAGAGAGISTHSDAGGISSHLDADAVGTDDQQHGGVDTTPDTHHGVGLTDGPAGLGFGLGPGFGLGLPDGDLDAGMAMDPAGLGLPDGDLDAGMAMDPAELGLPDGDGGMADGDGGVALPDADQYQVQPVDQQQMQPVDQDQVEHPEGPA
jgi:L,D-transpeptidase catalytic domain